MRHPLAILLICFCTLIAPRAQAEDKLKVVASFSILADIVKEVGGERIELYTLVGANTNPHHFEATPDAIKIMRDADLVIVNGISFESWMGRLVVSSGYSGPLIVAARNVTPLNINDKLEQDPHAWQSVQIVQAYVNNIRDALIEADRRNSARYKDNAESYLRKLEALENWIHQQIKSVPDEKRLAVVPHGSFEYMSRYYGIRFLSLSSAASTETPAADRVAKIIDQMRRDQVRAVFTENAADNAMAVQLQSEPGAFAAGMLYADSLSAPNGPAPNYIAMMRYNVTKLVEGMQRNGTISSAPAGLIIPEDDTMISIP